MYIPMHASLLKLSDIMMVRNKLNINGRFAIVSRALCFFIFHDDDDEDECMMRPNCRLYFTDNLYKYGTISYSPGGMVEVSQLRSVEPEVITFAVINPQKVILVKC